MNEVDAVYYLATNSDGGQNTRYPLGNKPALVAPVAPSNFKSAGPPGLSNIPLSWEHDGQALTGFELQQWILGTSSAWTPALTYPDASAREYDAMGLPQQTHIGHRIRTVNGDQVSAWAPEVWVDTDYETGGTTPPPVEPADAMFFDDFSSYTIGQELRGDAPPGALNGAQWAYPVGDRGTMKVGGDGIDGGNCLHCTFGAGTDYSYIEQHLRLCNSQETALQEVWLEFHLMTDSVKSVNPGNDKFLAFHNDFYAVGGRPAYGRQSTVLNSQGRSNGLALWPSWSCSHYLEDSTKVRSSPHSEEYGGTPPFGYGKPDNANWSSNWRKSCSVNPSGADADIITADQAHKWVRYRIHIKQNDIGESNGVFEVWREDELIQQTENIYRQWDDGYNKNDGVYLMGWRNSGMQSDALWKIDFVSVFDKNPGWFGAGQEETDLSKIFWAPSFNGHADGESMIGKADGAFWEGGVIDNTVTLDGEASARCDIKEGDVGSDQGVGHYIGIGKGVGSMTADPDGSEIWMRWFTRQEAGFSWKNGSGGNNGGTLKMMRFEPKAGDGLGSRKVEMQRIGTAGVIQGTVEGSWAGYHEGIYNSDGHDRGWWIFDGTDDFDLEDEKWEQWEGYCMGTKDGGLGNWKIWRNGVQVGLPCEMQTFSNTDQGYWASCMFITYWNAGSPKDQKLWYCRPAVAVRNKNRDDTPFMARDASGFPIIGMAK